MTCYSLREGHFHRERGMDQEAKTGAPGPSIEAFMTAEYWWREDAAIVLLGEQGGVTVFEIRFWDGCRYVGHTEMTVFARVDDLVARQCCIDG